MVRTHNKVELLHEENAEYRGERRGFWPSQWKQKKYKKNIYFNIIDSARKEFVGHVECRHNYNKYIQGDF